MKTFRLSLFWSLLALIWSAPLPAADATAVVAILGHDGATVLVDGKSRGVTPLTLRDIPAGRPVVIRIELEGHQPLVRTFNLAAGKAETWDITLAPQPAAPAAAPARSGNESGPAVLSIICPGDAAVFVDGTARGYTPVTLRELPAGQRITVRLELEGHQTLERTFTLASGKVETWETELLPLHPGFEVTTVPGAEVTAIDEQGKRILLGVADEKGVIGSDGKVTGEKVTLEVSKEGYESAEQKVPLDLRNRVKVAVPLRARQARLKVASVPAASEVYVNNVKRPLTGTNLEVQPDTELTVEIRRDGYAPKTMKVTVGKGAEQVLNFGNLDPVSGRVRVAVVTEQGPVAADFHGKARAFVDSREVPWNRGALVTLAPGRHEITVMHEAYNVTGDGPAVVDVKENATADVTLKLELKPARVRVVAQAKDKNGLVVKPTPPLTLRLDDRVLERSADDVYDVPSGREFIITVDANQYVSARRSFSRIEPGDEAPAWEPVLEWDRVAEVARLRAAFEADQKAIAQELDAYKATLNRLNSKISLDAYKRGKDWVASQRVKFDELRRRYLAASGERSATDIAQIGTKANEIDALLERLKPLPVPVDIHRPD